MYVVTDIYEYIVLFADHATSLNMLSVNKKFLDEIYYKRIIEKKYPYLEKLKSLGKPVEYEYTMKGQQYTEIYNYVLTWRQCYIKNLYFIFKIEKKYNLPYFNIKSYFPERLLFRLSRERKPYFYILTRALERGRSDIRDMILERNLVVSANSLLSASCKSGNLLLVKETYDLLAGSLKKINIQPGICCTVQRENLDILKFLLEKGTHTDLNYALLRSVFRETTTMMKYLISRGADNFTQCISFLEERIKFSENYRHKVKSDQLQNFEKYLSSLQNNIDYLSKLL